MTTPQAGAALAAEWWRPAQAAAPERSSGLSFLALQAFLFVLLVAPQSYLPALAPLRLGFVAAGIAIASHLFDCFVRRRPIAVVTRETLLAAALLTLAAATLPFSMWRGGSFEELLNYLKTIATFWLLATLVDSEARLERVAWGMVLMGIPLAATGVLHFVDGTYDPDLLNDGVRRIAGYSSGIAENPNDLALMLNLLLPVALALVSLEYGALVRLLLIATIGAGMAGVVFTFSRAGFITLAVIVGVHLLRLFGRRQSGWAFAGIATALVAASLLPAGYAVRLGTISDIDSDVTGSAQSRWEDTKAAVAYVADHPLLGAGLGMDVLALNEERGAEWKAVHNVFLEYAVDLGVGGLLLFASFYLAALLSARAARRRARADGRLVLERLSEGIETALLAFGVAGLFHPVAYNFYVYIFAGLAVAARRIGSDA